jgi:hypothetical protein
MLGFRSQFHGPFVVAVAVMCLAILAALVLLARERSHGRPGHRPAARALAAGAAGVVLVATAAPHSWPPQLHPDGDLVLQLGGGGLAVLAEPGSLAAVLLVANVLLYVPLGFTARLAWPRTLPVLAGIVGLSVLIEVVQWQWLGRVACTDDVVLNAAGGVMGIMLAASVLARRRHVAASAPVST